MKNHIKKKPHYVVVVWPEPKMIGSVVERMGLRQVIARVTKALVLGFHVSVQVDNATDAANHHGHQRSSIPEADLCLFRDQIESDQHREDERDHTQSQYRREGVDCEGSRND